MATVGYLEGVDPLLLTRLAVRGIGTLPISNGFDNHGKFINSVTERDEIDLIVGYLHKVLRTQRQGFLVEDILQACLDCQISVLIIVPQAERSAALDLLGKTGDSVVLVTPDQVYEECMSRLSPA